jgi:hypothetical protein
METNLAQPLLYVLLLRSPLASMPLRASSLALCVSLALLIVTSCLYDVTRGEMLCCDACSTLFKRFLAFESGIWWLSGDFREISELRV